MNEPKVVDFKSAKDPHVHARKESRVKKMRAAFKAAREAVSTKKFSLKKPGGKKAKRKKGKNKK